MKSSSFRWTNLAFLGLASAALVGCNQSTTTGPKGGTPVTTAPDKSTPVNNASAKRLTLTAAKAQTITRGGTDDVLVTINRDNFDEPVTIKFTGLPKGVMVDDKNKTTVIASGSSSTTVRLTASADAAVGEHDVTLSAEAPSVEKNMQTFRLTVKE